MHQHTGIAPRVALHVPWDAVEDYQGLAKAASDLGIQLGTINANAPALFPGLNAGVSAPRIFG